MAVVDVIWKMILLLGLIYFMITSIHYFLFAVLGTFFYKDKELIPATPKSKFYVLIPSYRSEDVALESARQAMQQYYPSDHYKVVLIADGFSKETISLAEALGINVIEINFIKSTKAKAIKYALSKLDNWADHVVILDVDNVMEKQALLKFDLAIQSGSKVLQAHRTAKNRNTNFAILDAISEEINNTIFRKGQRVSGLNAALIGSGMVFPLPLFREAIQHIHAVGGFDKELEMSLLSKNIEIEYLDQVVVYDEKVSKAEVLQHQRRRWLSAQVHYLVRYSFVALSAIRHLRLPFLLKYIQLLMLPRILHPAILAIFSLPFFFLPSGPLYFASAIFFFLLLLSVAALFIATPPQFYRWSSLVALSRIPGALLIYAHLLFKLHGANKEFIHTPHCNTSAKSTET